MPLNDEVIVEKVKSYLSTCIKDFESAVVVKKEIRKFPESLTHFFPGIQDQNLPLVQILLPLSLQFTSAHTQLNINSLLKSSISFHLWLYDSPKGSYKHMMRGFTSLPNVFMAGDWIINRHGSWSQVKYLKVFPLADM